MKGGSPALCSRAEPGPCVCDAQGSESQGDETHIYLQICPFQISIQSFLALPPGELSLQATERVCCLLPSPSSLRSATSPKGRDKALRFRIENGKAAEGRFAVYLGRFS